MIPNLPPGATAISYSVDGDEDSINLNITIGGQVTVLGFDHATAIQLMGMIASKIFNLGSPPYDGLEWDVTTPGGERVRVQTPSPVLALEAGLRELRFRGYEYTREDVGLLLDKETANYRKKPRGNVGYTAAEAAEEKERARRASQLGIKDHQLKEIRTDNAATLGAVRQLRLELNDSPRTLERRAIAHKIYISIEELDKVF
jgi:hypothetical protein